MSPDDANLNDFVQKKIIFFLNLFFKIRDFQITGSALIWVLNVTLENSKTNGPLKWLKNKNFNFYIFFYSSK